VSSSQDATINTVTGAENNGLLVQDWTTIEDGQFPVIANSPNTVTEYFNVLVRDSNTDVANISVYVAVSRKPIPGGLGKVEVSEITENSCTLTWEPATDFKTAQEDLRYQVTLNGLDEPILSWEANRLTVDVSNLNSDSSYSFSVIVKDEDGYEESYYAAQVLTLSGAEE
jgi:hypothetical protein